MGCTMPGLALACAGHSTCRAWPELAIAVPAVGLVCPQPGLAIACSGPLLV
jgi:hypothetical protein